MDQKIEIPVSRLKIILLLLGALAFVVLGMVLIIKSTSFRLTIFGIEIAAYILGYVSVVFFGLGFIIIAKKLFANGQGLVIDQYGITDHSNAAGIGLIEWKDIIAIDTLQIASTKMLILITDQPEKYIGRARTGLSKRVMKANLKTYGSPLSITSSSLKIRFNDLEKLIVDEFRKRKP